MDEKRKQELMQLAKGVVLFDEPMRDRTTIKIGGPADVWFEPSNVESLIAVVKWADENNVRRWIFGNGSNTLVRDGGIRGIVINLARFDFIGSPDAAASQCVVSVGAGVPLGRLVGWSVENSLAGLHGLAGIPGTVGGAVAMNAGTKDGTVGDVVRSVTVVTSQKQPLKKIQKDNLKISYRKLGLPKGAIVVEAELCLDRGDGKEIEAKIEKIRAKRKDSQPLLWPSMGSVFKNPDGAKAWQLIDDCGLRGVRVGGARIASEHANWIVNEGKATAHDVEVLIKMVRERVREKSGVVLETEVAIVGE